MATAPSTPATSTPSWRIAAFYVLMLLTAVGGFWLIRGYGETLKAPPRAKVVAEAVPGTTAAAATKAPAKGAHAPPVLFHVLLAMAAVIVAGRLLGTAFRWIGQPPVIAEVLGGILLGPSLLGAISPETSAFILPASAAPHLGVVAQLAIILYMFLVGLEFDSAMLQKKGHAAVAVSHASIAAPFLLGALLAAALYPRLSNDGVTFTVFAMFMGVAMAVTAFPVLARILTDQGIARTPLGAMALTCAAADDVTAWCLLAVVVGVARAQVEASLWMVGWAALYLAVVFFVVRPLLSRYLSPRKPVEGAAPDGAAAAAPELSQGMIAAAFVGLLVSALATEWIGVHAVFGAFLFGAVIPHDSLLARELPKRLGDLVTIFLLPAFFAFTGMRTQLGLVSGYEHWMWCFWIIVVATVGKFGGTFVAAVATGLDRREATALGILMNTRGLMELIVLNIGLDLGVISPTVFAMMVVMALATTLATSPLLRLLPAEAFEPLPAGAGNAAPSGPSAAASG